MKNLFQGVLLLYEIFSVKLKLLTQIISFCQLLLCNGAPQASQYQCSIWKWGKLWLPARIDVRSVHSQCDLNPGSHGSELGALSQSHRYHYLITTACILSIVAMYTLVPLLLGIQTIESSLLQWPLWTRKWTKGRTTHQPHGTSRLVSLYLSFDSQAE